MIKTESYSDRQKFDFSDENGFYVIEEGYVKIGVKSSCVRSIAVAGPCEIIGGIHVHGVNYTVTSIGDVRVYYVNRSAYSQLVEMDRDLCLKIYQALARTEYCREKQLYVLSKRSVRERISGTLLLLHEKMNEDKAIAKISLDKTTIADLSNTTLETLSRTLTDFESEGVLRRIASDIEILKPERLQFYFNN